MAGLSSLESGRTKMENTVLDGLGLRERKLEDIQLNTLTIYCFHGE